MLTSSELNKISVFACLNDANLMWLSQQGADLHLEPGEYLIHEGEPILFCRTRRSHGSVQRGHGASNGSL
jgi:hypothetical protein